MVQWSLRYRAFIIRCWCCDYCCFYFIVGGLQRFATFEFIGTVNECESNTMYNELIYNRDQFEVATHAHTHILCYTYIHPHALIHTQTDPFTHRGIYNGNFGRRDWLHSLTFTHSHIDHIIFFVALCLCLYTPRSRSPLFCRLSASVCFLLLLFGYVFFSPSLLRVFFCRPILQHTHSLTRTPSTHHHLFCKKIGISSQQ